MCTHLRTIDQYGDIYDRATISIGRHRMQVFQSLYQAWFEAMPEEKPDTFKSNFHLNNIYMSVVGGELLDRYDNRDSAIQEMREADQRKDERVQSARLTAEPPCRHCGKIGLRITEKVLHANHNQKDEEQVLFMLDCPHCNRRTARWEDGSLFEPQKALCPQCKCPMNEKSRRLKQAVITTYSCVNCGHSYKDRLDLAEKEESDPKYEHDRHIYCLVDDEDRERHRDARRCYEGLAKLTQELSDRKTDRAVYDAIANIQRLKIADLQLRLAEAVKSEGYIEFGLDKPEIGKHVIVGFSCLDSKHSRNDYDSRKSLGKAIKASLGETNWRLMSDGVDVRLGYLTGRLKAYESEEDLKVLVT